MLALLPILAAMSIGVSDAPGPFWGLSNIFNTFWNNAYGIIPFGDTIKGIYPIDFPLWFVRDLMIMAVITPLIFVILKRFGFWAVAITALCWVIDIFQDMGHAQQLLTAFLFFSIGAYISLHQLDLLSAFKAFAKPSFIIFPLLAVLIIIFREEYPDFTFYIKRINIIVGLIFLFNIAASLITNHSIKPSSFLASASFFIYCGHAILIRYTRILTEKLLPPSNQFFAIVDYLLLFAIITAFLLSTFWLMRRFTPRLLSVFTGGRN